MENLTSLIKLDKDIFFNISSNKYLVLVVEHDNNIEKK